MNISGNHIIGSQFSGKGNEVFYAVNPKSLERLTPDFINATQEEINLAFEKADLAFDAFREVSRSRRADFLNKIGDEIISLGDELIQRAMDETGLPEARIIGERGRTVNQLKLFADVVSDGSYLEISIDTAQPERSPIPKPDIRMMYLPIGPVAVFGASNFPLAFSVAGGDTASALAAGCPVVVKAHPAHPGTSELVGLAIKKAAEDTGMPDGVFSLLHGKSFMVGEAMAKHALTRAVTFTGSHQGGMALFKIAASRPTPIPCFAEMGSINPVFLLPDRLREQPNVIAEQYIDSVTLGVGQFCTNPGLVIGIKSAELNSFIESAAKKINNHQGGIMLHEGIKNNYEKSLQQVSGISNVKSIAKGTGEGTTTGIAELLIVEGATFVQNPDIQEEIFGPASIIVVCEDEDQFLMAARTLMGNLTATLQGTSDDLHRFKTLIRLLERKVGRILVNGFPTGVEVCHSMMHGGPYPATTDSRFTSVGTAAIKRFLRPVCYQNFPEDVLYEEMRSSSKGKVQQKINGEFQNKQTGL